MSAAFDELFTDLSETFGSLLKNPDNFLRPRHKLSTRLKKTTKALYDKGKSNRWESKSHKTSVLPQLVIDGFDDEQIWQELELQNDAFNRHFVASIARIYAANNRHVEQPAAKTEENKQLPTLTFGKLATASDHETEDELVEDEGAELEEDGSDLSDADSLDNDELFKNSLADDDRDYGSMSEDEIELEKALDQEIARNSGVQENEDEASDNQNEKESAEEGDSNSAELPNLLESADGNKKKKRKNLIESEHEQSGRVTKVARGRKSIVDDQFFKLSEMENFLNIEDEKDMKTTETEENSEEDDDDDQVDFFGEIPSSDSEDQNDGPQDLPRIKGILKSKYVDFFGKADDSEDQKDMSEEEENADNAEQIEQKEEQPPEVKSNFELQQELLRNRIEKLEESNLSEKPWQLRGETSAVGRPENSILEEHLQFDHLSRPAPIITEETTLQIEQLIKQRIKDQTWDNVERKIKPIEDHSEYKKRIILDQEKSKLSLAEIYEQQYIKQQQREKVDEEKEDEAHQTIKKHMEKLFTKLDALTNFHFMPKPPVPDVKIVNNKPAITVEDVAPVGVSDAALLAPEEVKEKSKREVKSKEERNETDKLRERRTKKSRQKHKRKDQEARKKLVGKMKPGLGNKYSKINALKELENAKNVDIKEKKSNKKNESLKSSKTFFSKLQEEVQTSIQTKKMEKRNKDEANKMSVDKLKL